MPGIDTLCAFAGPVDTLWNVRWVGSIWIHALSAAEVPISFKSENVTIVRCVSQHEILTVYFVQSIAVKAGIALGDFVEYPSRNPSATRPEQAMSHSKNHR